MRTSTLVSVTALAVLALTASGACEAQPARQPDGQVEESGQADQAAALRLKLLQVADPMMNGEEAFRMLKPLGGTICLGQPGAASGKAKPIETAAMRRWLAEAGIDGGQVSQENGVWSTKCLPLSSTDTPLAGTLGRPFGFAAGVGLGLGRVASKSAHVLRSIL